MLDLLAAIICTRLLRVLASSPGGLLVSLSRSPQRGNGATPSQHTYTVSTTRRYAGNRKSTGNRRAPSHRITNSPYLRLRHDLSLETNITTENHATPISTLRHPHCNEPALQSQSGWYTIQILDAK
ncbi:hypothetical protein C8Q77DRAFT_583092 [Trametes polyzona]|nr:hypothetical protein C8Q77DRAFT_583092 [Trametes polyzona]